MTAAWSTGGSARDAILSKGRKGLGVIIKGMGSLSYGELAGERMKLGLLLHDPEEEHDCFSDNTHNSHYFNAIGIRNVYVGRYKRIDGQVVQGVSLADTVKHAAPELHSEMINQIDRTIDALSVIVRSAKNGVSYDQLISEGNTAGSVMVLAAIDALTAQTRTLEKISSSLGLANTGFEGSDSLDNPDAIFK
jgi:putative iron-regulated protein